MTSQPRQPGSSGEHRLSRTHRSKRRTVRTTGSSGAAPSRSGQTRPAARPTGTRRVGSPPARKTDVRNPNAPPDHVELSCSGDVVYLRVVGLGNAARSVSVRDIGDSLIRRGYDRIVVDLGDCRGLDSTFMGTLVALAAGIVDARELAERKRAAGSADPDSPIPPLPLPAGVPLVLCNVAEHVVTQLRTLGLLGVDTLRLMSDPVEFPACAFEALPDKPGSPDRRLAVIREAHERLIELDERNEARFGPFLRQMLAEMDSQQPGSSSGGRS